MDAWRPHPRHPASRDVFAPLTRDDIMDTLATVPAEPLRVSAGI